MQIKVLKELQDTHKTYKINEVVEVEVDIEKTPTSKFWRRIFKDMIIDNCIEFINDKKIIKNDK